MKFFVIIKNLFRNVKSNEKNNSSSTTKWEYLRKILLFIVIVYILMIFPPLSHLQSFIPNGIVQSQRFLLIVAHPDDECLFFSPTILALIARNQLGHLLVLSTGNSRGLGPIREKELLESCQILQIDRDRCIILNRTDLQDNPSQWWPKDNISLIIDHYIRRFQIDLVITFDRGGISGHVNHRSIALGMEYYISRMDQTPLIYQLSTVSSVFEYTSIGDLIRTLVKFLPRLFVSSTDYRVLFVNSPWKYLQALRAFHAHRSQVLWYRHIYTIFSRHMFINDLVQISQIK